ncbi:MAG TPA: S8 family serine peptidase [Thermoanaerobaculia bacterium]|jgi:hypothetical protein
MKRSLLLILFFFALPAVAAERVIVEFREAPLAIRRGVTAAAYTDTLARFRRDLSSVVATSGKSAGDVAIHHEYFRAFHGAAVSVPAESVAALKLLPYVVAVHLDTEVQAYAAADSIGQVGARQLWAAHGARGQGMVIAILDTGIDYNHPALGGGFGPGRKVIGGWDFVNNDADPMDDQHHGTHVAGIAAAKSANFNGVAPEASLIAYKVLNANGRGMTSQIIAAIERTVDPNGDGDLDDRVDVANLSLGGPGGPNDAGSRAIDNATAAGVVFCVASGNDGDFLRVGSPGTARSAITVGASTGISEVALFSSCGPNTFDSAVKPEVLAPGDTINSTISGGGFGTLSGTSMATPHVTGLAALLLQLHPNWTPAEVKSALMTTARGLGADVMAQGAGVVDGALAATTTLVAEPAHVSFGLANVGVASWTAQRTIRLRNRSTAARQVSLSAPAVDGVAVAFAPAEFELAPGAMREVTVTLVLTNADAVVTRSYTVGGLIQIDGGPQPLHLPWGAVKAARTLVSSPIPFANSVWFNEQGYNALVALVDPNLRETLMPAGTYDLVLTSKENGKLRLHVREQQVLNGSHEYRIEPEEATTTLTFAATDERGERLFTRAQRLGEMKAGYSSQLRVVRGERSYMPLPLSGRISEVSVTPLSDRWKVYPFEVLADLVSNDFYVVEHDTLTGVTASRTLTRTSGDLLSANVQLEPLPGDPLEEVYFIPYIVAADPESYVTPDNYTDVPDAAGAWRGRVHVTEKRSAFLASAMLDARSGRGQLLVPALQGRNGRVISSTSQNPSPAAYSAMPGETLTFGNGPFFSRISLMRSQTGLVFATGNFMGQLNDWRNRGADKVSAVFRDGNGNLLRSGTFGEVVSNLDAKQPMAYELELTNRAHSVAGYDATGTATFRFDTRRTDVLPPTITSFRVLDGNERATATVGGGQNATLTFSAADYLVKENLEMTYQRVAPEATKVWWRRDGGAWRELTAVQGDEVSDTYRPDGIFYRTDLAEATHSGPGRIDLRVEILDTAGNSVQWTLAPAFVVEPGGRRRSAEK